MRRRTEMHTLTGVYALNALSYAEQERFERHLQRCPTCASEVRGLQRTAAEIGLAAAVVPPGRLHDRVMTAVARTRQLPPLPEEPQPAARRRSQLARSRWYPRIATAIAAAGVAAAMALGAVLLNTQHQLDQVRARNRGIAAVMTAPDARLVTQATSAGGKAVVVVSSSRHELVVTTSGLPALPRGKVYELWLMSPGRATPAGLLTPAAQGTTRPVLASAVEPGDRLGLTVEPAGGSAHPTTSPILDVSLG